MTMGTQVPYHIANPPPAYPMPLPPGGPIGGAMSGFLIALLAGRKKGERMPFVAIGAGLGFVSTVINRVRLGNYNRRLLEYQAASGMQCSGTMLRGTQCREPNGLY